jgi:hypothetical protein
VQDSTRHLLNAINKGDFLGIMSVSNQYIERGVVQFDKILSIPACSRVPNLTHVYGFETLVKLVAVLLASFNNSLNLIRPMNDEQVIDCATDLVMTTEEDQLSVEDLVLFFKGAKEGKYGRILDRMDSQTVFAMMEEYREQRHREYVKIKDEKHANLKSMGPTERTNNPDPIAEKMCDLVGKIGRLKEQLKDQREINRMKKFEKDL